jgi:hypothetical protein
MPSPAMRFETIFVSREHRYALCRDLESGKPAFALPVRNQMTEYDEWYDISEHELAFLLSHEAAAIQFARQCGARMHDVRLILRPGLDRGAYD